MQVIELPSVWRPLSFGNQNGTPVIWFEADRFADLKPHAIYLVFTGEEVPEKARYIGTQTFGVGGAIVIHCYVR